MNELQIFVIKPLMYSAITYWGLSAFWLLLDIFLAPYGRIQGGEVIDWKLYKKTALHVLKLHLITPFVLYSIIPIWKWRGIDTSFEFFITFKTFIKLCLCPLLGSIFFYIGHRISHYTKLYKTIHKKHHEWIVPCAVAASYSTVIEYLFFNLPVFLLPPMILNINWHGAQLWFIISTISVVNDHCGYTFLKSTIHHTNHHKYQNYNYGSRTIDDLMETKIKID